MTTETTPKPNDFIQMTYGELESLVKAQPKAITVKDLLGAVAPAPQPLPDKAHQEEGGALSGAYGMKLFNIPIVEIGVGGFVAILVSKGLAKVLPRMGVMVVELAAAVVLALWGHKIPLVSRAAALAGATVLTFDAIRQILPIDNVANRIVAFIPSIGGSAGQMESHQAQGGGSSRVVNRLAVTNI